MYSRVYVEITNICNKSCSFCHKTSRKPHTMTAGEFATVCEKLRGVTKYIYLHVMGEPLLHPHLCELISHAKDCGFNVAVTTNGSLLCENGLGDKMIDAGLYKANISLHSFEKGDSRAYKNYINSCLDFADKASSRGVLTVLRLWNGGSDESLNDETLSLMHEKFPCEWSFSSRGARIRNRLHLEYGERFIWPDISYENMGEKLFCYGLDDHFGILCDGTVIPCCLDSDGVINLGNIFGDDINSILSSKRASAIRDGFKEKCAVEALCQRCSYARRFKI